VARQGLKAYLVDKYLNTQTQVSLTDTTRINFSVLNIPGSYAADRFMLVFVDKSKHVPLATTLNCQKSDAKVLVNWEAMGEFAGGAFEVERSADGVNFSTIHTELLHSGDTYSWIDANPLPGTNFYRIHNPDPLSKTSYSNLVKIVSLTGDKGITVSPNPVTGNLMKVRFNSMEGGDYLLKLFTQSGQLLFTKNLVHAAGSGSESVKLRSGTPKGVYKLEITSPDGSRIAEQVLVQ
jgi:hypothetical protein